MKNECEHGIPRRLCAACEYDEEVAKIYKRVWVALDLGDENLRGPSAWEDLEPRLVGFRQRVEDAKADVVDEQNENELLEILLIAERNSVSKANDEIKRLCVLASRNLEDAEHGLRRSHGHHCEARKALQAIRDRWNETIK